MKANGVTDAALAKRIGRERSVVTRYRNGEAQPSLDAAWAIAVETGGAVRLDDWFRPQGEAKRKAAAPG
jgi:transcriptional regulator with XRE-family HTH domain